MISPNPLVDLLMCLLFWAVLLWLLWQGLEEWEERVAESGAGRPDIHDFPDELGGEPGPGYFTVTGNKTDATRGKP